MMFTIEIKPIDSRKEISTTDRDSVDFETAESMIMTVCGILGDNESCSFHVSGFGDDCWPVDVCTDMSCFIEQLNPALQAITNNQYFELDFYEQGIERRVCFDVKNDICHLSCMSGTDWKALPENSVTVASIENQLGELKTAFVHLVLDVLPFLEGNHVFEKWRQEG